MKTKTWIALFLGIAILCGSLAAYTFLISKNSDEALIYSNGTLVKTVSLDGDGTYRIGDDSSWNVIVVSGGKLFVKDASCASKDCVHQGASSGGAPIICLPNRLVIEFSDSADYDALLR